MEFTSPNEGIVTSLGKRYRVRRKNTSDSSTGIQTTAASSCSNPGLQISSNGSNGHLAATGSNGSSSNPIQLVDSLSDPSLRPAPARASSGQWPIPERAAPPPSLTVAQACGLCPVTIAGPATPPAASGSQSLAAWAGHGAVLSPNGHLTEPVAVHNLSPLSPDAAHLNAMPAYRQSSTPRARTAAPPSYRALSPCRMASDQYPQPVQAYLPPASSGYPMAWHGVATAHTGCGGSLSPQAPWAPAMMAGPPPVSCHGAPSTTLFGAPREVSSRGSLTPQRALSPGPPALVEAAPPPVSAAPPPISATPPVRSAASDVSPSPASSTGRERSAAAKLQGAVHNLAAQALREYQQNHRQSLSPGELTPVPTNSEDSAGAAGDGCFSRCRAE